MKFQKEHRISMPAARFMELMFDAAFDKQMQLEGMGNVGHDVLERSVAPGGWVMRTRMVPKDNMPAFIKKLVGGGFSMEERRLHQQGTDSATGELSPSALRDKVKMGYRLRVVPDGETACKRIMEWEVEVKIFGIGGQIEKFIAQEIERGMDASAAFFNRPAKIT